MFDHEHQVELNGRPVRVSFPIHWHIRRHRLRVENLVFSPCWRLNHLRYEYAIIEQLENTLTQRCIGGAVNSFVVFWLDLSVLKHVVEGAVDPNSDALHVAVERLDQVRQVCDIKLEFSQA